MIFLFLATSNGPLEAKISSDHEGNFVPQKLVGGGGTFDFLHSDLFVIVYLVFLYLCVCDCLCICLCVCLFVFFSLFAGSEWRVSERRRGERYFLNQIRKVGSKVNRSITNHL